MKRAAIPQRKLEMIKRIEALIAALTKEQYERAVGIKAPYRIDRPLAPPRVDNRKRVEPHVGA